MSSETTKRSSETETRRSETETETETWSKSERRRNHETLAVKLKYETRETKLRQSKIGRQK